jgi:hypothetical protein
MKARKTIHEKWEEGGITVLPHEKLTKKEILKKLKDPDLTAEEKAKLTEKLYEGIDVKKPL